METNIEPKYNHRFNKEIIHTQKHQAETAVYIADMILELRNLSKASELKTLQGLLEIAYYEAFSAANRIKIPADEYEHLQNISKDARKAAAVL